MSKVSMTVRQILDLRLWDEVCEYKGWNPWMRNEGQIEDDEVVEFDSEFKKEDEEINIEYGKEYERNDNVYCIIQKVNFEYYGDKYEKYIVAYRNLNDGITKMKFELKDLKEIKYILELDEY